MVFYKSYRADQIYILGQSSNPFESYVLVEMMGKELRDSKEDIFYHKKVTLVTLQRGCGQYNVTELSIARKKFLTPVTFLHITGIETCVVK